MANDDQDLELDVEGGKNSGGISAKKKKFIIIAAAAVLLIGGGTAAFLILGGDDSADPNIDGEEEMVEEDKGPAIYIGVPEALTSNIPGKIRSRTVQIKMSFMVRGVGAPINS